MPEPSDETTWPVIGIAYGERLNPDQPERAPSWNVTCLKDDALESFSCGEVYNEPVLHQQWFGYTVVSKKQFEKIKRDRVRAAGKAAAAMEQAVQEETVLEDARATVKQAYRKD